MGFFSRLFGGSDRIELQDIPAETEEQISVEKHDEMPETHNETQKPADDSPFFDENTNQ